MKKYTIHLLPSCLALITMLGIAVHDTKFDTMIRLAIAIPVAFTTFEAAQSLTHTSDLHTHVDKVSVKKSVSKYTYRTPSICSRNSDDKRYRMNNKIRGQNPFDDCLLPV